VNQQEAVTRKLDKPAHALSAAEVVRFLGSSEDLGLTAAEARVRLSRHGHNELREAPPVPLWRKFVRQFQNLVIWILLVGAFISGVLGEWPDTIAIAVIVVLNAVIGFVQEERAERSLAGLRKMSAPYAKVVRDGHLTSIPARDLVPGDRIELEAGDQMPADGRLVTAFGLAVQESALTGESTSVEKDAAVVLPEHTALGDRRNIVYMGTVVSAGKASAVVTATGMQTELGRIAGLLERYEPEPTPLQRRLDELGKVLVIVCLSVVALIFALQWIRGGQLLEVFLISISLAVAAVPEGLPAVVTLVLAVGVQRMARRNALVRRLPSVETLGSVTVICSDKTGTLTRNEMTVRIVVAGKHIYQVTGIGYVPRGEFVRSDNLHSDAGQEVESTGKSTSTPAPGVLASDPDLVQVLTIAARCNHAEVVCDADREDCKVIGDPTEGALIVMALKGGVVVDRSQHDLRHEIPFDSERKAMSVVVQQSDGLLVMYTKGAPEVILAKCTRERRDGTAVQLTSQRRNELAAMNAQMASQALRVLGLAYRDNPTRTDSTYAEEELVFAGLVGMIDPPREEAKLAVAKCHDARIRPVMITGDHPATAAAIARELGIAGPNDRTIIGDELDRTTDAQLVEEVERVSVYARVSAEHKLRVVKAWKHRGHVVAMTGDGVNDAPAVKSADIGIAMGITGTDVTKEAADMVLTDDNFASIVSAVEEGRQIFDNIQKVVQYLLSTNAGEVLLMLFTTILGWPIPLTAIQILWINLVTDGLPALALGMEPPEPDIMARPPRPPREAVISFRAAVTILMYGGLIATVAAVGFAVIYQGEPERLTEARTAAFAVTAFSQLCFSFACRSGRYTMPQLGAFTNRHLFMAIAVSSLLQLLVLNLPAAQAVFEITDLRLGEWGLVLMLALVPVTIVELAKIVAQAYRVSREGRVSRSTAGGQTLES